MTVHTFSCRRAFLTGSIAAAVAATLAFASGCATQTPLASAGIGAGTEDLSVLISRTSPAVVAIGDEKAVSGSGFRLEGTQYVATAAHVVKGLKGAPRISWKGQHWSARLVTSDEKLDVALIEIPAQVPTPGLKLAPPGINPLPGNWIVVLGCPFGMAPTATTGIISAVPGAIPEPATLATKIQLNAAVNPGNSGGPVVNLRGEVIGIANATIPGGFGLGFAVPVEALRSVLESAGRRP